MEKEIYKHLIHFLKYYHIYEQFMFNTTISNNNRRNFKDIVSSTPKEYYICVAFDWRYTMEGFTFWSIANKRWNLYIKRNLFFLPYA